MYVFKRSLWVALGRIDLEGTWEDREALNCSKVRDPGNSRNRRKIEGR